MPTVSAFHHVICNSPVSTTSLFAMNTVDIIGIFARAPGEIDDLPAQLSNLG